MEKEKMEKMFKKYPFLWAIKDSWHSPHVEIKAMNPTEELFQETYFFNVPKPPCYFKSEIWVYIANSKSCEVKKIVAKEGTKLGEAILERIIPEIGEKIENIVLGGTMIIKPPKNISFYDFIANALKNEKGGK